MLDASLITRSAIPHVRDGASTSITSSYAGRTGFPACTAARTSATQVITRLAHTSRARDGAKADPSSHGDPAAEGVGAIAGLRVEVAGLEQASVVLPGTRFGDFCCASHLTGSRSCAAEVTSKRTLENSRNRTNGACVGESRYMHGPQRRGHMTAMARV